MNESLGVYLAVVRCSLSFPCFEFFFFRFVWRVLQ